MKIQFDQFEIDTEQKSVSGPDGPVSLRPQTFAVLCHLIEQAPSVVSRDDLLDAVWGHQATSVSSVAQTIKELRQALGDSSSEPRLIATRRRLGYQFVAQVQRPDEAEAATSTPAAVEPEFQPSLSPRTLGLWPWPALGALVMVAFVAAYWTTQRTQPAFTGERLPTLAVAQMVNASDDPELNWLGPALETYLGHALVELGGFRVLVVDPATAADESQLTDIDFLIEGRYLTAGVDGSRLLASLRRPGSGEIVSSLESGLGGWGVAALSIDMASSIRDRLGFAAPPGADSSAIRARLPRLPGSQRAYFGALEALAWMSRGDWNQARNASEQALAATRLWPRRDRLELEATAAALDFDFERAADNLQALTQFYPEPESSRRLVDALIRAGRLRAAQEALDSLRLQRPRDPRVALLSAQLAQAENQHEQRLEAARLAVLLANEEELAALLPGALLMEAGALIELGRLNEARQILDELFALNELLTDAELAQSHLGLARVRFQQGELGPALESAELAFTLFDAIPHPAGQAESLLVAGAIHDRAGRIEASLAVLEQAVEHFAELGDQRRQARSLVQLGVSLMRANQSEAAIEHLERGARHFRHIGDRQGEGAALINHATLLARSGRLIDSEPIFERALEAFTDAGDLRGQAMALGNLAGIAGDRRDWSRSIALAEQSLGLFELLGAQTDIARVSYNLGVLHRRRGDLLNAEFRIEQAAEAFGDQGAVLMQTRTLTTLGAILVSMGRFDELDAVLERIEALDIEDDAELSVYHAVIGERALLSQDLDRAREHFSAARDLMMAIGADNHLKVSRLNLARLELAEGRLVSAEQAARDLIVGFGEIRSVNRQIDALMLLAESLIEQDRHADAASTIGRAEELLEQSPDAEQALKLALLRSRVSDPALAAQRLEWVEQTAGEQGFMPLLNRAQAMRQNQPQLSR
ncbi:MAG: winged helix-turn-helix domain-containing protein [Wenzhouxiangella sp.]|nr:winged helix-turn-helix domain-containing protein [Wenzhouxiangella sp.]